MWPVFPEVYLKYALKRVRLFGVFFDPQTGMGEVGKSSALKYRLYKQTLEPIEDHMTSWPYDLAQAASPLQTSFPHSVTWR